MFLGTVVPEVTGPLSATILSRPVRQNAECTTSDFNDFRHEMPAPMRVLTEEFR